MNSGSYLFVIPVEAYRVAPGQFAIEGAFASHLRLLRDKLGPLGARMVILSPQMSQADYQRSRASFAIIDEEQEGIRFRPAFEAASNTRAYVRSFGDVLRILYDEIREADVVHSNPSSLYRPFELPALVLARALGKKTISVSDIDRRNSARMRFEAGLWSRSQLVASRLLHEPYCHLQQLLAVRGCSLVLMKGQKLVDDYGGGRAHVKNFLDAAFTEEQIIPDAELAAKVAQGAADLDGRAPLAVSYFGRLVEYKGVDHMLRAVACAVGLGAKLRFHVIGDGPERASLEQLADRLDLGQVVEFHGAIPFGPQLFAALRPHDVLLATPLSEDTPRNALDAMACGQALVAYDSYYYRELAAAGAGVVLVPWHDPIAMGQTLAALAADRPRLAGLMQRSARFARENTQESWLDRRVEWTRALFAHENADTLGVPPHVSTGESAAMEKVTFPRARKRWAFTSIAPAARDTVRSALSNGLGQGAWRSIPGVSRFLRPPEPMSRRPPESGF